MAKSKVVDMPPTTGNKHLDTTFRQLAEAIVSRSVLASSLGKSFHPSDGGEAQRELYKALGYKLVPQFQDYLGRYTRQDIAKPIVDAKPEHSWKIKPKVFEPDSKPDTMTAFEAKWERIVLKNRIWHYLERIDKIAGIGEFGVLLIGVNDGKELEMPLSRNPKGTRLLYLRPYTEQNISILEWEEDTKKERYGMPLYYGMTIEDRDDRKKKDKDDVLKVHWSRCIHVAEDMIDDDVYGTPRLRPVLNRLEDLERVAGGSAEMFWRGALPGYAFKAAEGANFKEDDLEALEDEIQEYLHELRRYLRLSNVDVESLAPQVSSPKDHADLLITLISAATRIPKRILLGSERGELASNQDERAWLSRIETRREEHCGPTILRPFIDRLIKVKVLPKPKDGYEIEWEPLLIMGEKEHTEIDKLRMEIAKTYAENTNLHMIIPEDMFLEKYMDWDYDDIMKARDLLAEMVRDLEENEEEPEQEPERDMLEDEEE